MSTGVREQAPQFASFEPRYDLTQPETTYLIQEFLETPDLPDGKFICASFSADHPMSNVGRTVERIVFGKTFGNDVPTMKAEYGKYEPASRFFVVIDRESQQPAGVLRVLEDSPAGLKSLNDIPEGFGVTPDKFQEMYGVADTKRCWDIGTLAVIPSYRGSRASTLLYRALFLSAEQEGIQHMVTIIDRKARRGLQLLGIPFEDIRGTEAFEYIDSKESHAMHGDVAAFRDQVSAAYNAALETKASPIIVSSLGRLATGAELDASIYGHTVRSEQMQEQQHESTGTSENGSGTARAKAGVLNLLKRAFRHATAALIITI